MSLVKRPLRRLGSAFEHRPRLYNVVAGPTGVLVRATNRLEKPVFYDTTRRVARPMMDATRSTVTEKYYSSQFIQVTEVSG